MKVAFMIVFLVTTNALADSERRDTGNTLAKICKDWDTGEATFDKGLCAGFINGVRDEITDDCEGSEVTKGQLIKVVVKFMDDHPEELDKGSAEIVHRALVKAFPCKK